MEVTELSYCNPETSINKPAAREIKATSEIKMRSNDVCLRNSDEATKSGDSNSRLQNRDTSKQRTYHSGPHGYIVDRDRRDVQHISGGGSWMSFRHASSYRSQQSGCTGGPRSSDYIKSQ